MPMIAHTSTSAGCSSLDVGDAVASGGCSAAATTTAGSSHQRQQLYVTVLPPPTNLLSDTTGLSDNVAARPSVLAWKPAAGTHNIPVLRGDTGASARQVPCAPGSVLGAGVPRRPWRPPAMVHVGDTGGDLAREDVPEVHGPGRSSVLVAQRDSTRSHPHRRHAAVAAT